MRDFIFVRLKIQKTNKKKVGVGVGVVRDVGSNFVCVSV